MPLLSLLLLFLLMVVVGLALIPQFLHFNYSSLMLLVVDGNRADEKSVVITRGNGSWPFSSNAVECYVILNGKLINQKCNNPSKRASKFRFDMVVNLSSALL